MRFTVNGRLIERDSGDLLTLLRGLDLTSVKDGCAEGACGACMVLVNGRAVKACVQRVERLEGAEVLTLEGLAEAERQLFARAFVEKGAVQCGFCIPGMIISAKALLDKNPDPSLADVRRAINNNLCRCTGYKKIEQAILYAAALKRSAGEGAAPVALGGISGGGDSAALSAAPAAAAARLGDNLPRVDALDKALGRALYADDIRLPGLLHGAALRPAYARARILSLDTAAALALPGVRAVLTAADIPGSRLIGHLKQDYPVMIGLGEITRFRGDALALVAAESEHIARAAAQLIKVEYQPLPGIFSPERAAAPDAPLLHADTPGNLLARESLARGDAARAIAEAAHVARSSFILPPTEHAFLEPECAAALPEGEGLRLISGDQGIYQTQKEVAAMLGLAPESVRVQAAAIGGGFGGKEDMSVQHHAALLAWHTQQPVKMRLSRAESMQVHPKRHAMRIEVVTACDAEGMLTAFTADIIADSGAYASLGGPVLQRACTHAAGPYRIANVAVTGRAYYTNNPPAGAFRGFGVTQSVTAAESNLDLLAEMAGISPWQMRRQNAVLPGDRLPNGQIAGSDTAIAQVLDAIKPFMEAHPRAGLAAAMKNSGLGVGVPDIGRCRIRVEENEARIYCSAACIGQGMGTVLTQMVGEISGLPLHRLSYQPPDTALAPDSGNTTASRQTLFAGEAARLAARDLAAALKQAGGDLNALMGREFYGEYRGETDRMDSDKSEPRFHVAYSYAAHAVALDAAGRVEQVLAVHDVGRAVNPLNVEGQIEGGVTMSLGYALREDFPLKEGAPQVKFAGLGLLRAMENPEIIPLVISPPLSGAELAALPAAGAKGIGEIASIPTPAAVINAYRNFDGKQRTELPLKDTPYSRGKQPAAER